MKTFQIGAILESYRSLRDGTLKICFETQEITPEKMANIHWSLNKFGYFAFAPDAFASKELEEIDKIKIDYDDTSKSQAQRIRAVLYILWNQNNEGYELFPDYYKAKTEKYIEHLKRKIES